MNFEAWWDVMKLAAVPGIGFFAWWIHRVDKLGNDGRQRLHEKLDAEIKERHRESEACRIEHREAVKALIADLNTWKVEASSRFATATQMERGFDRVTAEMASLGKRLERFLERRDRGET
jgi:hypothetical protein